MQNRALRQAMNSSTLHAVLLALVLGVGCGKKAVEPQAKAKTMPKAEAKLEVKEPEPSTVVPAKLIPDPIVEAAIREILEKPTGEFTKVDLEKVTQLILPNNQLTDVKGLEKLTQLTRLNLHNNQLTDVKGLEKLTQLTELHLFNNPDLTKAQIAELQKALPNCKISHNATK